MAQAQVLNRPNLFVRGYTVLLAYTELLEIVQDGIISPCLPSQINGTSIDVSLGEAILIENSSGNRTVSYKDRDTLSMRQHNLRNKPYKLCPGEFILAHTIEVLNLPLDLSAEYMMKSSMGRIGLNHATAGWIDAGFSGSITLELYNSSRYHAIELSYGDPIGQLVFLRHVPVPYEMSYRKRGRYQGDSSVHQIKP